MGVQCQIIMWPRLRGALRVCPVRRCGRTEMVSLLACTCVVQACGETGVWKPTCNQTGGKHVVSCISAILFVSH